MTERTHINSLTTRAIEVGNDVYTISKDILDNPNFLVWSGSSNSHQHHYGKGGLVKHILEVVDLCFMTREYYPEHDIDPKELFLAAFFHDIGKLYDYAPVDGSYEEWENLEHKRMIHHISRSGIIWSTSAKKNEGIYNRYHDKVLHAILAHHGQRAYGSPIAPKSRVAWILHHCDSISARVYDADTLDITTVSK